MNAKYLAAAVIAMSTAGCAYTIKSAMNATDWDTGVDFSKYSTFFMMKGNSSGNPAIDQRVVASVEAAMADKGWLEVEKGEGQAAVVVHTATEATHEYADFFDGWGGWAWRWTGTGSTPRFAEDYKPGTAVVTIFDTATQQAIWRGIAPDALPAGSRHAATVTEDAVETMFKRFPPVADRPIGAPPVAAAPPPATDLPAILFSAAPAVLVRVDGAPVFHPVPGTDLERVVNTRSLILRDVAGACYLKILDGWMEAYSIDAEWWTISGVAPDGAGTALQQAKASNNVDLLDGSNPNNPIGTKSLEDGPSPAVFVSTRPAELIVTDGPMVFAPIGGTGLQYVANTTADLFREPTDQELYLLTSGRWLRSWKTVGPWRPVAANQLPGDFGRIPDGSPKAGVKASIHR